MIQRIKYVVALGAAAIFSFSWGVNSGFELGGDITHCANYAALEHYQMVDQEIVDEACAEALTWSWYHPTTAVRRAHLFLFGDNL